MLTVTLKNSETATLETVETMETKKAPGAKKPAAIVRLIPGEAERPKFVVIDDWHEEDGIKYQPGVWHFGAKHGKGGDGPPTLTQKRICSPLHIDAVTTDAHATNYGRLLRFKTTLGRWKTWAMPMSMLRGDASDLRGELLGMGVEIDPYSRNELAVYLQGNAPKRRIECALQTGWAGAGHQAFVLPDTVIGPKAATVTFQSGEHASEEYATAGTLAGWQEGISALAVGNPMLVLGLCIAFAGPVLARCGQESGGIHLFGKSSTGKSSILKAACSVWGGAGYQRSWRTTGNGLEGAAALFNDSLLALDEISECDPKQVGEVVYMLGNGRGKQRAGRTGSARAVTRWLSSVLSNGENSIVTTMAAGGHLIKAGQSVRLLDVHVQRSHGAWDNLHHLADGTEFSNAIKDAAGCDYGHAGRAFLEKLTRDHADSFVDALDSIKTQLEAHITGSEGQAKRVAARFAVVALAGELATSYGVTGWPEGEAIRAAAVGFAAWQSERGNDWKVNSEGGQIVEKITSFIERHGDSRFSDADSDDDHRAALVRDRAGWWRSSASDGGRLYLFNSDGLREALTGFDFNRALDAMQQAGLIDAPGADGKRRKSIRIRGQSLKLYAVRPDAIEGGV